MRVIYAGTGDIGLPTLRWLLTDPGIDLLAVICQPDKPVGRKQKLTPPATKQLALEHGIEVRQPEKLRTDLEFFDSAATDLIVVMAYGQLLTKSVLEAPRIACLNLHASILPRHRGASPIQAAIREGDEESGVTVMYMDKGMDTGDILLTHRFALAPDETGGSLHDRLAEAAPSALAQAIDQLRSGLASRTLQDNATATHCGKLTRNDGRIDWSLPAACIERQIRAYDPWPGTSSRWLQADSPLTGKLLKIFPPTQVIASMSACDSAPGTVVDTAGGTMTVQTGEGLLRLLSVQLEGKRRMDASTFLKGNPLPKEAILQSVT
ncbi:MAG: methionyl-tRNA formyltransferase [Verrucomicrobiales bacterium]